MGTIYSTEHGRMCPECERPLAGCACDELARERRRSEAEDAARGGKPVRVLRDAKSRKGKVVTVVRDLPLGDDALRDLAKRLKRKCGTGGTVKEGVIEIQGDHRELIAAELEKAGHRVRKN